MSGYKTDLFFWQISRLVLTPLLAAVIAVFYKVISLTADDAVQSYHTYPVMFEHILCGVMLYLAFSLIIAKIHHASLHDGRDSGKK